MDNFNIIVFFFCGGDGNINMGKTYQMSFTM